MQTQPSTPPPNFARPPAWQVQLHDLAAGRGPITWDQAARLTEAIEEDISAQVAWTLTMVSRPRPRPAPGPSWAVIRSWCAETLGRREVA